MMLHLSHSIVTKILVYIRKKTVHRFRKGLTRSIAEYIHISSWHNLWVYDWRFFITKILSQIKSSNVKLSDPNQINENMSPSPEKNNVKALFRRTVNPPIVLLGYVSTGQRKMASGSTFIRGQFKFLECTSVKLNTEMISD